MKNNELPLFKKTNQERPYEQLLHYGIFFTYKQMLTNFLKFAEAKQAPFLRGLFLEGLIYGAEISRRTREKPLVPRVASLIVGRKCTVFALFYFVFEGNFQVQAPGGLIFGGAI